METEHTEIPKIPSNGESEKFSNGESKDTYATQDIPPLAACVNTLQAAVQISIQVGLDENCLFTFSRAIKAFEITCNRRLSPDELQAAFSLWWATAQPLLPADAEFDEYRFDFEDTFSKTNAALGSNSLDEAVRRAEANPHAPKAARYSSPKLKLLVAVCYNLQLFQGSSPFFISVRDAAMILEMKDLNKANAMLNGLVRDGVLTLVEKGAGKRATRFRFNSAESKQLATPATKPLTKPVATKRKAGSGPRI